MSQKDELDALLDQWQDVPEVDPQLKHHVWTRIAADDSSDRPSVPHWIQRAIDLLSNPLGATAFVAASVAVGIFMAELRVSQSQSSRTQELAQNYIQLIEARAQTSSSEVSQ